MSKAILLFSGGLDSILTAHILKREGLRVKALYCHTVFSPPSKKDAYNGLSRLLSPLKISLKTVDISSKQIKLLKNARYGYGKNLNPCIDCKIVMFKEANKYKKAIGADFVASGEVLGERPMSQRKDVFNIIERDSGLKGLILRPLSAKLLKSTVVEDKGLVKRDNLYGIQGRGRRNQLTLTEEFGIKDFPNPSGGCLLTNPSFCRRLKDIIARIPDFGVYDCELLKVGRHFRLSVFAKLIVSRNKDENIKLKKLAKKSTTSIYPLRVKGPFAMMIGKFDSSLVDRAAHIVAHYCKSKNTPLKIKARTPRHDYVIEVDNSVNLRNKMESRGRIEAFLI